MGDDRPALVPMLVRYVLPILRLLAISVTEPRPGLGNYADLMESEPVRRVLWTTARICLLTTLLAVLLGYVVAYAMTSADALRQRLIRQQFVDEGCKLTFTISSSASGSVSTLNGRRAASCGKS